METKKEAKKKDGLFTKLNNKRKKIALTLGTFVLTNMMTAMSAFADTSGGDGLDTDAGKDQFDQLINFFATWIGRIGGVIALVGAVMFGFAWKNEDADGKQRGVTTMVSGIIVFAISLAADFFTNLGG